MIHTFARCVADAAGRLGLDYRRATFGRLLFCDLLVMAFMVARTAAFEMLRHSKYLHYGPDAVTLLRLFVYAQLIASRVHAHRGWRYDRWMYYEYPDCRKIGQPGASRFLRRFYPRYMEEDEWDLLIVVEPLLSVLYGLFLLFCAADVAGLLFVFGGICLVIYGKDLRDEIRHEEYLEEQRKLAKTPKVSEAQADRRHFASVVSPPRKAYEDIAGDESDITDDEFENSPLYKDVFGRR